MSRLEQFLHTSKAPTLVTAGLAHAQFETIHPFLDGNGRTGRLLVSLLLRERGVLSQPVLYLSIFLKRHRAAYFNHLTAIREEGDWEGWLTFFLSGVADVAHSAAATAESIHRMRERDRGLIVVGGGTGHDLVALDRLFSQPLVNAAWVVRTLGVTKTTANKVLDRFCSVGVLRETTGNRRNRLYRYDEYVDLFDGSDPVERDHTHG